MNVAKHTVLGTDPGRPAGRNGAHPIATNGLGELAPTAEQLGLTRDGAGRRPAGHRASLDALRTHPLAMDPTQVHRLCSASLRRHSSVVVPFMPGFATSVPPALSAVERAAQAAGAELGTYPGFPAGNNGVPPPTLDTAAREYLALEPAQRPPGTIRRLAEEHHVNFHQLLAAIGELQLRFG